MPDVWQGDQAAGLRRLFGGRAPQVVAFASGREACGRTALVVQAAGALAAAGHGVVLIDENPQPANAVAAFGAATRYDLMHAVRGERPLRQVMVAAAPLVQVVAAHRAARELDPADAATASRLPACLRELQRGAGFVLIDTATRRGGQLSPLALAAPHVVVVAAATGSAITHAYALIKRLAQEQGRQEFQMVIQRARSPEEARGIFDNIRGVAREHLGVRVHLLGEARLPVGDHVAEALLTRLPTLADDGEGNGFVLAKRPEEAGRRGMAATHSVV